MSRHGPRGDTVSEIGACAADGRGDVCWAAHEAVCIESKAGTLTPVEPTSAQVTVNGHSIQRYTGPTWALYALRLPDGNVTGEGFPSTDGRTLGKLQSGEISSLPAIDGSTAYDSWEDLVTTLREIVSSQQGTDRRARSYAPPRRVARGNDSCLAFLLVSAGTVMDLDAEPGSGSERGRFPLRSVRGGLGHREVGAVPPAAVPAGEGRGVRGCVDTVGT
jgi:hypothetical protein